MIRSMETPSGGQNEGGDEGTMFLVDKPLDWTSFDVVHRLRQILHAAKAGHAGTLDPRATGLLIICTGRQTKRIQDFADLEKEYTGSFELGIRTPSFDMETPVSQRAEMSGVTQEALEEIARGFIGKQLQTPPMFSAVKHHGKPLYKYARKGKTLERKAKEIEILEFSILSYTPPSVRFRIRCSKGTYIRSLVNDVGEILGCGAVLTELRRTRIGTYSVEDALTIEKFSELHDTQRLLQSEAHEHRIPA